MKVVDNFLPEKYFTNLQQTMLSNEFPWYYLDHKSSKGDGQFQFVHNFYDNYILQSPMASIIEPLVKELSPSAIVRIKANLTTKSSEIDEYLLHTDIPHFKGKTAVFYINDNNGYTVFEDGNKVYSKANRLAIFDSGIRHAGSTCTNAKVRCVLNLNYYTWEAL